MDAPEQPSVSDDHQDTLTAARAALDQAARVAESALALLRAELRLARSSALAMLLLGFALILLGVGAWLAASAAVAAGIYQVSGNLFYGIGGVALLNIAGAVWALLAIRRCWRDLGLPRTRRALGRMGRSDSGPARA